ncbi:DUF1254 domain-containing protein [Leifsonia shinshuensis]|uniref:DUF1254 domain-containing protein n=2 Tax=Leifsonia shinshuensis TaxID=150026 RepID=A0A7G6YH77_9MICO|nr:DUF1254 domain-containing protein [Leifsonia shinshuensis]
MDVTRSVFTQPGDSTAIGRGRTNTLAHARAFPDADFRAVVAPNFDTLYSSAWLDLSDGPIVLDVPDSGGRYYLLPLLDMWTNAFAVPGKRTTGTAAGRFLIAPPGWDGEVPDGTTRIDAPTAHVWLIGRVQTNGPSDYAAVREFQDGLRLSGPEGEQPSTALPVSVAPDGLDLSREPLAIVNGLTAVEFFGYAARLLAVHAPQATDFSALARLASLGIVRGEDFDGSVFDDDQRAALERGAEDARQRHHRAISTMARIANGWAMNTDSMGVYGDFYLKRAAVTVVGLGANQPEDAIYPIAVADSAGRPIVGERDYVQHFERDQLPPVDAFWSVTMYDQDSFQAPNPLDRFALGDRDLLHYGDDGSLDLYYGPTDPGGTKTANWLPAPAGPLRIIMRLYAPRPEALDGRWNPPPIAETR